MTFSNEKRRHLLSGAVGAALLSACGGGGDEPPRSTASRERTTALAAPSQAVWSPTISLPLVPAAAASLPDGKVLFWSAEERFSFGNPAGRTYSAMLDPSNGSVTERTVTESGHNMFCPGTTNLADGRLLVNGGISSARTSIFNPSTGVWTTAAQMTIPRGYNANTILPDGSVLTLGGSWSGGVGNKHGEVWTESTGWRRLTGVAIDSMLSVDTSRNFGGDSHFWLIPNGNGRVLYAGPGVNMSWIDPRGNGAVTPAGRRGDDEFSVSGTAVMYEPGKILKVGGSPGYEGFDANANAYVIDVTSGVNVRKLQPMNYARVFHNSVVLPNGQVVIIGGQTRAAAFTDDRSVLAAELFDPTTETFMVLPPMSVPRNYHGVSLLLPDARVLTAGGGLCGAGCAANHPDAQVLSPHYLFNADGSAATRPVISGAPAQAGYGTSFAVTTDASVTSFALVRLGSATHTVNNDQRRVPLQFQANGNNAYMLQAPSNPGIALPGMYMLFALNADGVPSVARIVRIGGTATPQLDSPSDQSATLNAPTSLALAAISPGGSTLSYSATGLPPGLSLNTASGLISGTPSVAGSYAVTVRAANANGAVSSDFVWRVAAPGAPRYVRLEALSEIAGNPWTSMAELNLLDDLGNTLSRTGWQASADSVELAGENGAAANAIDGNPATFWHTQWQAASPPHPHSLVVDLGTTARLAGFRYLPRAGGGNGTIALFNFYVSADGIHWGNPVASGDFRTMGAAAVEKTVLFSLEPPANRAPTIGTPAAQSSMQGQAVTLAMQAGDPDGDALSYVASGLPSGLAIGSGNGVISGTPMTPGTSSVTVQVSDNRGGNASATFDWTVLSAPAVIDPVHASPVASGGEASYTATATGNGLSYAWDFGDGTPGMPFSASPSVTHRYASAGLYSVTLAVRDDEGRLTTHSFTQAVADAPTAVRPSASSSIVFEPRSGANARVWVANPDNNTVSVFDAVSLAKLAEVAVGNGPRTLAVAGDGRVWVVNKEGTSLSVISGTTLAVVQTVPLPRASQPYGIAFSPADGSAWVTLEASGQLLRLNGSSGAITGALAVGPNPRQLSISSDGAHVLVSRFITPPLAGEGTASVQTSTGGGEVVIADAAALSIETTALLRHSDKPDNTIQGRGVPNYLGAAVISPDGRSAWVPSKQDNVKRGVLRDGLNLDFQNTVRAISSRIDLSTLAEDHAARVDHDNAGVASAAVFHPSGAYLFVALETSRQVAVLDAAGRRELMRFDAGRAPQGLAVSADGLRLFTSNFMDRSVSVHDLTRLVEFGEFDVPLQTTLAAIGSERLSAQVLAGKRLFYDARDPRLARDGYISCAACHRDGGHDGRTWDLRGFGEGLRNTIALRGRAAGHGPLHWSGNFDELHDFEAQIRTLAQGSGLMTDAQFNTGTRNQPLGDRKAGVSADLDALAAYVASLNQFDPSPRRNADGTLSTEALVGRNVFAAKCASCHSGSAFTNSVLNGLQNVGTLKPSSGQRLGAALNGIDPPSLRDVWATAPYLHDGSAPTIADAVRAHTNLSLNPTEVTQVAAFVAQIGSEEPAVASSASGGLQGNYYNSVNLGGAVALARTEAVNFDWGSGAPGSGVNSNNFSVRWQGSAQATASGGYRFRTVSDDGVRLWVNGVQVINNWTDHAPTTNTSATINLVAGQRYTIRLEYYERGGGAVMRLQWRPPGVTSYVAVPATQLYAQ